jgi:signal transduction histidine kinase
MVAWLIRRWDNAPLRVKGSVVIGIPLIPLVVFALLALIGSLNAGTSNDWMGRANRTQSQIAAVLSLVVDAGESVSAFLLTRNPDDLRPFAAADAALAPAVSELRPLVRDSPEQLDHVRAISAVVARHPLTPILEAVEESSAEPVPLPTVADGRAALATIRRELAAMRQLQDRRIAERSNRIRGVFFVLGVGGAVFGLLFGGLGMKVFVSGIVRRVDRLRIDAGRLLGAEPLDPPQHAADELGDLTLSIHETSRLLRAREDEARQHVTILATVNHQLELRAAELAAVNEELEAFSYSVSHDLRAPLRHVTGFATLLQHAAAHRLEEKETRYLRTIVDAATRMGRLIDDLLAFSRMGRAPIERRGVSLDAVVAEALEQLPQPDAASPIEWNVHALPEVEGDPALLRQVFVNLLTNAIKYSSGRPRPAIEIGTQADTPGETVVYVRDNGVGFDMAYVHKLFGVFQRLHSSDVFEGTGIGLANVRRIVQRHGGRAWAEGAVDGGATFYFSLPLRGERA